METRRTTIILSIVMPVILTVCVTDVTLSDCWWLTGPCDWLVSVFMICDLFVWVRAWLLATSLSRPVQATVGEWMVCLSLSLSALSRPGPVERCRPEPSSARGRHIGGQRGWSAPRSHQGQELNKQAQCQEDRRPGSGHSSDFHFRRTMLSRGKTENMGDFSVGTLRELGGGVRFWGSDQGSQQGG